MGHNSVVLGQPKSTGILQIDGLSMGPPDLGRHTGYQQVEIDTPWIKDLSIIVRHSPQR